MRYLFYIGFIVLSLMIVSCGGGGGSSSISSTTTVSINLGHREITADMQSIQAIPLEVSCIEISFSSPGETTIEKEICDFGSGAIEEIFEVKNCHMWHITVEAFDENGIMIFTGDTFAHFDGGDQKVSINMVSVEDITPPVFNGIETADASEDNILLSWSAASDNVTPAPSIEYLIFMSDMPGDVFSSSSPDVFASPAFSVTGNTSFTVSVGYSTTRCFGVRAKDEVGNTDSNNVVKCATTLSSPIQQEYTLTVSTSGSGSGTVTSSPSGIGCGGNCSEKYDEGTEVTLTAIPSEGSTFVAWSGDCGGGGDFSHVNTVVETTNTVNITMNDDKTCIAIFESQQQYTLTVELEGCGSGTASSNPGGINCSGGGAGMPEPAAIAPSDCSETYDFGTDVTLTATPDGIYDFFNGWSGGGCIGTGQCQVTMDADKTVTAAFDCGE